MEQPLPPKTPLTPLGTHAPRMHPALYGVIAALSLVIIAVALWAFWPHKAVAPQPTPTPSAPVTDVVYRMDSYGLMVKLPDDWSGFSVRTETWEGADIATGNVVQAGPKIVLRHPAWTQEKPYEDLPILVLSPAQWRLVSTEQLSLGAAPIGSSILASSSEYVFALPARYNYDFSQGFEELDAAIRSGAVSAVEPIHE